MNILITIYVILATLWGIRSAKKTKELGPIGALPSSQVRSFLTNFVLFPFAVSLAIKKGKF